MKALLVTPDRNTPGKYDYAGAFLPEAKAFARFHGLPEDVLQVNLSLAMPARRAHVLAAIDAQRDLDLVAFFCHGLSKELPQFGLTTANVAALAQAIAKRSKRDVRLVLYACSTAEGGPAGDNGFADRLRDELCIAGAVDCQVDAHEKAAHTTMNPFVRRFEGLGSRVGGPGGYYLVTPNSSRWKSWRAKLKTSLRYEFPLLSAAAIQERL